MKQQQYLDREEVCMMLGESSYPKCLSVCLSLTETVSSPMVKWPLLMATSLVLLVLSVIGQRAAVDDHRETRRSARCQQAVHIRRFRTCPGRDRQHVARRRRRTLRSNRTHRRRGVRQFATGGARVRVVGSLEHRHDAASVQV